MVHQSMVSAYIMRQIRITITHIRTCAAVCTARTAELTCFSSSCTSLGRRTGTFVGVLVVVVDIDVVDVVVDVACDVVVDVVGCVDVGVGACDDVVDAACDVVVVVDVDVVVDVGVGDVVVVDAACDCDVANVVVDAFFAALIGTT